MPSLLVLLLATSRGIGCCFDGNNSGDVGECSHCDRPSLPVLLEYLGTCPVSQLCDLCVSGACDSRGVCAFHSGARSGKFPWMDDAKDVPRGQKQELKPLLFTASPPTAGHGPHLHRRSSRRAKKDGPPPTRGVRYDRMS